MKLLKLATGALTTAAGVMLATVGKDVLEDWKLAYAKRRRERLEREK